MLDPYSDHTVDKDGNWKKIETLKPANYEELIRKPTVKKHIGPARRCRVVPYDRENQLAKFIDGVPHEDEIEHPTVQDIVDGPRGYEVVHKEEPPHWTETDEPAPNHYWVALVPGRDDFNNFYLEVPEALAGCVHSYRKEYARLWTEFMVENKLFVRYLRGKITDVRKWAGAGWRQASRFYRWAKRTIVSASRRRKDK